MIVPRCGLSACQPVSLSACRLTGRRRGSQLFRETAVQTERRQLGDVAEVFIGVPTKQSQLKDYGPAGNVLTVRALREFGIDRDQLVRAELDPREIAKYHARQGDL